MSSSLPIWREPGVMLCLQCGQIIRPCGADAAGVDGASGRRSLSKQSRQTTCPLHSKTRSRLRALGVKERDTQRLELTAAGERSIGGIERWGREGVQQFEERPLDILGVMAAAARIEAETWRIVDFEYPIVRVNGRTVALDDEQLGENLGESLRRLRSALTEIMTTAIGIAATNDVDARLRALPAPPAWRE